MAQIIDDVAIASAELRRGELVAFATETVYGLGGVALWPETVVRIFEVKGRPSFDPLIVHVPSTAAARHLVTEFPRQAEILAEAFWPGPLTLVLPKVGSIPDLITSGLPAVAIRVPSHPQALELLQSVGLPVAAPSANLFGRISPTTAAHVEHQLGSRINWILDGGPCQIGVESTVLTFLESQPVLLRHGGIPFEEIESVVGQVALPVRVPNNTEATHAQLAPGSLPQHYAPRTPLVISDLSAAPPPGRWGALAFQQVPHSARYDVVEILSPEGELRTAAANLFAAMRRLDELGLDGIMTELFPEAGLGRAINDRLRRAAYRAG